jgi:hypothetical protein
VNLGEKAYSIFLSANNFAHFSSHVSQLNDDVALTGEDLTQLTVLFSFVLFLLIVVFIGMLSSIAKFFKFVLISAESLRKKQKV